MFLLEVRQHKAPKDFVCMIHDIRFTRKGLMRTLLIGSWDHVDEMVCMLEGHPRQFVVIVVLPQSRMEVRAHAT